MSRHRELKRFIEMISERTRFPIGVTRVNVRLNISSAPLTLLASMFDWIFITPVKYMRRKKLHQISYRL